MQAQIIRRVTWLDIQRHTKTDRLALTSRGRWGPKWLHQTVFRLARNLGMLRHEIIPRRELSGFTIEETDRVWKTVSEQAEQWLDNDFYRKDLIIIMGNDQLQQIMHEEQRLVCAFGLFELKIGRSQGPGSAPEYRLLSFPCYIIPNMSGAIVLPRSLLSCDKNSTPE